MIHKAIGRAVTCRLAMAEGEKPYVVPMCFGFDGEYFFLHSARNGKKVEILKKNPHVCLELETDVEVIREDKPCRWSVKYFSVICEGTVETVEDAALKSYALNVITRQYQREPGEYTYDENELEPVLIYRVRADNLTGKISGPGRI